MKLAAFCEDGTPLLGSLCLYSLVSLLNDPYLFTRVSRVFVAIPC